MALFFLDISSLVSLLGCLGGTTFGFFIPITIHLIHYKNNPYKAIEKVIAVIVLVFTGLLGIFGVIISFSSTVASWAN